MEVIYNKINEGYEVIVNNVFVGELLVSEDGIYNLWLNTERSGYLPSWFLREIANKLDELNKDQEEEYSKFLNETKDNSVSITDWF